MSRPPSQSQTSGHRYALKRLSSYLDGQLSARERARVQAHLDACPDCRAELRSLRWTQGLLADTPVLPVPRSFIVRQADLEAAPTARALPRFGRALAGLQAVAALVAVLLVLVIAGDLYIGNNPLAGRSEPPIAMLEIKAQEADTVAAQAVPVDGQEPPNLETMQQPEKQPEAVFSAPTDTPTTQPTAAVAVGAATATAPTAASVQPTATPEPTPTWTPRPTHTSTPVGSRAEGTSTQNSPTPTAPEPEATPTPEPRATVEPTATIEPTATDTLTPEPTATTEPTEPPPTPEQRKLAAAPTDAPKPEREESVQIESVPEEPGQGGAVPDETLAPPPPPPAPEGRWLGWRIAQATLGVMLAGLVLAIVWLRIKGR